MTIGIVTPYCPRPYTQRGKKEQATTFERVAPAGGGHEESNPKAASGASEE